MGITATTAQQKPFTADDLKKALEAIEPLLPPKIITNRLVERGCLYSIRNDVTHKYEYFCHPDDLNWMIESKAWLALDEKMKKAGA